MWEIIFNVLKLIGIAGGVSAAVIAARIWLREQSEQGISHAKDDVIALLRTELELARIHADQADKTVLHYRDEMHTTRKECDADAKVAQADREDALKTLKQVEIENATLRAKTDLSPVMGAMTDMIKDQRKFFKEQTDINAEVLTALRDLKKA